MQKNTWILNQLLIVIINSDNNINQNNHYYHFGHNGAALNDSHKYWLTQRRFNIRMSDLNKQIFLVVVFVCLFCCFTMCFIKILGILYTFCFANTVLQLNYHYCSKQCPSANISPHWLPVHSTSEGQEICGFRCH